MRSSSPTAVDEKLQARRAVYDADQVSAAHPGPSERATSKLSVVLVTGFIAAIHIEIYPRFPIPFPVAIACALLLLLVHRKDVGTRNVYLIGSFIALALATVVFSPRQAYFVTKALSFGYLATSVLCGLAFYTAVSTWNTRFAEKFFLAIVLILVVGTAAEFLFAPVKALSDAYRTWNFPMPYENDFRDFHFHGGIRPKFFSAEPSHVAKMFLVVLTVWYCLSVRSHKLALAIVLTGILAWSLRSPSLLPAIALLLLHAFLFPKDARIPLPPQLARVAIINLAILAAVVLAVFADHLDTGRIQQIVDGQDNSFTIRVVAPFTIIPELLSHAPFLGIGVGGVDAYVTDTVVPHYSQAGIPMQFFIENGTADKLLQNVLSEYLIVFGLAGSVIGLMILSRLVKVNAPGMALFFFINLASYCLIIGGLVTIRFWVFFFALLFAGASIAKRRHAGMLARKRGQIGEHAFSPLPQGQGE